MKSSPKTSKDSLPPRLYKIFYIQKGFFIQMFPFLSFSIVQQTIKPAQEERSVKNVLTAPAVFCSTDMFRAYSCQVGYSDFPVTFFFRIFMPRFNA